jgi:hypothetical protein
VGEAKDEIRWVAVALLDLARLDRDQGKLESTVRKVDKARS